MFWAARADFRNSQGWSASLFFAFCALPSFLFVSPTYRGKHLDEKVKEKECKSSQCLLVFWSACADFRKPKGWSASLSLPLIEENTLTRSKRRSASLCNDGCGRVEGSSSLLVFWSARADFRNSQRMVSMSILHRGSRSEVEPCKECKLNSRQNEFTTQPVPRTPKRNANCAYNSNAKLQELTFLFYSRSLLHCGSR